MNTLLKRTFSLFAIFNFCIGIAASSHLTAFRGETYYAYHEANPNDLFDVISTNNHPYRPLLCITDKSRDAIVWNTLSSFSIEDILSMVLPPRLRPKRDVDPKCEIDVDSSNCFAKWTQYSRSWRLTNSFDTPMGPVFDRRWEDFTEYSSTSFQPVKVTPNGQKSTTRFNTTGGLSFSIRGSSAIHLLLCESENFSDDLCYWLSLGGSKVKKDNFIWLKRCKNGLPADPSAKEPGCTTLAQQSLQNELNNYEWKTFVLIWKKEDRTLKLYDPDEQILSYSDRFYNNISPGFKGYHIFYRSPEKQVYFRFHSYSYIQTTVLESTLTSPPLRMENDAELCIDMMVGLCKNCGLAITLMDESGEYQKWMTIIQSPNYKYIKHDLPMWQHARISLPNVSNYTMPITLEFTAVSTDHSKEGKKHWAITKLDKCLPEKTVRSIKMTTSKRQVGIAFWPTVKCQRLSYDHPHSEVVDVNSDISRPPNELEYCPNFHIGPYCETYCGQHFGNDCLSVVMCTTEGCFCTQGYKDSECNHLCSSGSYGYGCVKTCGFCKNEVCNPYTGICELGCDLSFNKSVVPPYCNIDNKEDNHKDHNDDYDFDIYRFNYHDHNYNNKNNNINENYKYLPIIFLFPLLLIVVYFYITNKHMRKQRESTDSTGTYEMSQPKRKFVKEGDKNEDERGDTSKTRKKFIDNDEDYEESEQCGTSKPTHMNPTVPD